MRCLWILVLFAACSENGDVALEERLANRRIALGLDETLPIPFGKAMHALEETLEPELKRAALGRLDLNASLDSALRISSALQNADLTTRTGDPEDFVGRMRDSARQAEIWAQAAVRGDPAAARREARALLDSCIECHRLYRN